jgi:hypothetical protein
MARMTDQNDHTQGPDHDDLYDDAAPRSIFAATWFRAVLVLIVLGVIGAVAVPYILDAMNAPPPKTAAVKPVPAPPTPPAATPAPAPPPAAPVPAPPPTPVAAAPSAPAPVVSPTPPPAPVAPTQMPDKPAVDKKDSVVTATATEPSKTASMSEVKPETKPETKPAKASPAPKAKTDAKPEAKPAAKASSASSKSAATGASTKQWYVQVGAFKDAATAKRVATKLRDDSYTVEEWSRGAPTATVAKAITAPPSSSPAPSSPSGDQYDVIISGQSPADLNTRLSGKGLTAESTPTGAVVKPSLPLRDAVALSKDLAVDGLKVQVRRAGSSAPAPRASAAASSADSGDSLHRVSVGGFADRATAVATLKELEGKGYKPFLTRR